MRRLLIILMTLVLLQISCLCAFANDLLNQLVKHKVTFGGFGPIKIGMTINQASNVLGIPLNTYNNREPFEDEKSCYYVYPKGNYKHGVSFMITKNRISRIDIDNKLFLTLSGAGIGDSGEKLKKLYSNYLSLKRHFYTPGFYYILDSKKNTKIIFEVIDNKVRRYRVGKTPEVAYVEGCS